MAASGGCRSSIGEAGVDRVTRPRGRRRVRATSGQPQPRVVQQRRCAAASRLQRTDSGRPPELLQRADAGSVRCSEASRGAASDKCAPHQGDDTAPCRLQERRTHPLQRPKWCCSPARLIKRRRVTASSSGGRRGDEPSVHGEQRRRTRCVLRVPMRAQRLRNAREPAARADKLEYSGGRMAAVASCCNSSQRRDARASSRNQM